MFQVIYDDHDQVSILEHAIKNVYTNYSLHHHGIETCKKSIDSVLSSKSVYFKNKAFDHEQEVRLVLFIVE